LELITAQEFARKLDELHSKLCSEAETDKTRKSVKEIKQSSAVGLQRHVSTGATQPSRLQYYQETKKGKNRKIKKIQNRHKCT